MPNQVANQPETLRDHIDKMKSTAFAAVNMRKTKERPQAAADVIEDIILVTLHKINFQNLDWPNDQLVHQYGSKYASH